MMCLGEKEPVRQDLASSITVQRLCVCLGQREAEGKEGTEGDSWKDMQLYPKCERSWGSLVWVCHCLRCTLKESLCLLLRKKAARQGEVETT